ncbi:UDP-N-acetylglucosamine transferase subunit alg14 [Phlyctema vagabunda]|uniref:UDP-N-acetylglucosamine transferase subunit ALG14 n=1 Tax=Phlyctema vagabunda TaxID=108571 RepID=A0ABR4PWH9_9HELO
MISLLRAIDITCYKQRTYICMSRIHRSIPDVDEETNNHNPLDSSGDDFSQKKAVQLETQLQSKHHAALSELASPPSDHEKSSTVVVEPTALGEMSPSTGTWQAVRVHRARKIHQPLWSTPLSCARCFLDCMRHLSRAHTYPDVVVINGPATAVLVVLASYVLKFLGLAPRDKMKIIYVESFARVCTLSLSGRILLVLGLCDRFLVQWHRLQTDLRAKGYSKVEWRGFLVD